MNSRYMQMRDYQGRFMPMGRTKRLSIRLTPREQQLIRVCAYRSKESISNYILGLVKADACNFKPKGADQHSQEKQVNPIQTVYPRR